MRDIGVVGVIYNIVVVAFMIFGAGLFFYPTLSIVIICRIAGVIFSAYGIVKLVSYFSDDRYQLAFQFDFAMGLFYLVLGVALIFYAERMTVRFPMFVGSIILMDAVFKVQTSLDAKKFGLKKWWLILLLAIVSGIVGGVLIFYPMELSGQIFKLIGLNFIFDGLLNLWVVLYTVRIKNKKKRRASLE